MPRDLFFSLSHEKQSRIIEASVGEFSKALYQDTSINQIIKNAGISRGSFYQYFDDKDDLYFYVLENIIQVALSSIVVDTVGTMQGSIIAANRDLFILNLKLLADERYKDLFKNLYLSINQHLQQRFKTITDKWKRNALNTKFKKTDFSESESRYIKELMNILELINRDLMIRKIVNGMDDESILEIYDYRIHVLNNLSKSNVEDMI